MRITIIGAGFSGSTLATLLATTRDEAHEVCLVGITETFGRGVAYGEARPEHLLNVRARGLGADPDDPGEFADWLQLDEHARDSFLPRQAYGEYLHDRLRRAQADSSNLTCIEEEAIALERAAGGFRVHLADGSHFASERVVLAPGALPPQRLVGVGPRLARDVRYIGWPWQENALEQIAPDARLLVVGTGLTMVDVVNSLRARGHRGPIVALSRHGLLPQRHHADPGAVIDLPPHVLQALRAHDLNALVRAMRSLAPVVPDWRALIDALRPHVQAFWQGLSMRQRARFLRHMRAYWDVFRHRLAPRAADDIDAARASGQLAVRAGRLLRAGLRADAVEAVIHARGSDHGEVEHYDHLIRATGLDTDVARTTHPLMTHLREAGLVAADALGLGIDVSARYEVLDAHGRAVPRLHCLGPLLRARLWEITAVPELRQAARELAGYLLDDSARVASRRLVAVDAAVDADARQRV